MRGWKNNMKPESEIIIESVSKVFQDRNPVLQAIKDISLTIHTGEFFIFLGPSGCGKSTLLRLMSGLDTQYEGSITIADGITRTDIGFVFQQFALLPYLTVEQNIELNLIGRNVPKPRRKELVHREIERFHLERFRLSYPRELSGGQRQRVGIARALAANPRIIFMDEPFSELDSFTAKELREEFLDIWRTTRPTIVMVTHLVPEAIELADRIAVLTDRPALVKKIITNTLPRPRIKRSNEFYNLEDTLTSLIHPKR